MECKRTSSSGIRYSFQSIPTKSAHSSVHLRLVCQVGSLHETDSQRGAAHYIEHLGFRATRSHGHGELVNLVTSFGSGFGPDLNAQTGLSQTIWQLDLPRLDLVTTGLQILNEWAFWIRIADEDVDCERNVIVEEFRHKQTAGQRAKSMFWDLALPLVAQRIPIGTLEFIQSVTANELRTFYDMHYVPANLCVVCVVEQGLDCDSQALLTINGFEGLMEQCFSKENCPVRSHQPPLTQQMLLPSCTTKSACIVDPDLAQAAVSIEILTAHKIQSPQAFFRRDVVKRILSSIMDERFRHTMLESEVPLYSGLGFSVCIHDPYVELSTIKTTFVLSPEQTCKDISNIFLGLLAQLFAAVKSGFSSEEVSHAKMKWRRNTLQRTLTGLGATEEWVEHYRLNERAPVWGFAEEQARMLELLDDGPDAISTEEVCLFCRNWLECVVEANHVSDHNPTTLLVFFQGNHLPTGLRDSTLLEVLEQARSSEDVFLNAPSASPSPLPQFDYCEEQLRKAVVAFSSVDAAVSTITHTTSLLPKTGVELHRFSTPAGERQFTISVMQSEEKKISLQAFALGGASEFDNEADDVCFSLCGDILRESGLGELSGSDLLRLEACTGTRVFMQRHLHHRGLGGSAPSHELELLLHMVALRTESFKVDTKVLTRVKHREREALQEDTMGEMQTAMRELAYGKAERLLLPHTMQDLDQVSSDRLTRVAREAFGACDNFTFCIIGQLPPDYSAVLYKFACRVLLRASTASLPFTKQMGITQMKLEFDSPSPTRFLYQGETDTDKSQVMLILSPHVQGEQDWFLSTALCEAIRLRLLAKLRTDRAQVYSVSCEFSSTPLASNAARMFVSFSCAVERDEELVETTKQLLKEMAVWGFSTPETEAAYALMTTKLAKSNTDSHKLFRILDAFKLANGDALMADDLAHGYGRFDDQNDIQQKKLRLVTNVARMVQRGINCMVIRHRPPRHHKL
ncbi:hypothetical protein BASA81_008396 [Batrachochytrium salamandrivorans]|nr:hypothetical protein BASA81_008396 [Batrachochytrium salamandrivorans]